MFEPVEATPACIASGCDARNTTAPNAKQQNYKFTSFLQLTATVAPKVQTKSFVSVSPPRLAGCCRKHRMACESPMVTWSREQISKWISAIGWVAEMRMVAGEYQKALKGMKGEAIIIRFPSASLCDACIVGSPAA